MANILIIRFSAFGDVTMLVPEAYSVARSYPGDHFFVLTNKRLEPLFKGLLSNLEPIGIDLNDYKGVFGIFRLAKDLVKLNIDKVADVHDVIRSKLLRVIFILRNIKVKHIDKGRGEKKAILSRKSPIHPLKHTTERYHDVFSKLGYPAEMQFESFFSHRPSQVSLPDSFPFNTALKNIGIAPFAKHNTKMYPLDQMEQLISRLSALDNINIYLFGNEQEMELLSGWHEKYNTISVTEILTLEQELYLMSRLNVLISMDSANMHLASLVRIPVISVWGATHPCFGFYGFKQSPGNAVQIDLECRPCSVYGNKTCARGDLACLKSISSNLIYSKIMRII